MLTRKNARPLKMVPITGAKQPLKGRSKQGWISLGDRRIYFRSQMEVKYAKYLEHLKATGKIQDWEYEPKTFWFEGIKRGVCSYKPDFLVTIERSQHYWVEVKGYMDQRSRTKIKRFGKYFPEETLMVCDTEWFRSKGIL
jgi:hypothetical protein